MASKESFLKKYRRGLTVLGLVLLSFSSMVFQNSSMVSGMEVGGQTVFFTFQSFFSGVGSWFSDTINSIQKLQELEQINLELQGLVDRYQGLEQRLLELQQENFQLREALDFRQRIEYDSVPAQIVAKDPGNYFQTITIDKGYSDGIRMDMPVTATQEGYFGLVGKIVEVGLTSSQIRPLLDQSSFVAGRFQESRYEGMVRGLGTNERGLVMEFVSKSALDQIDFGDLVMSSGMKSLYPKGISIGRINQIRSTDYETHIQVYLTPVIDFQKLEYVSVLLTKESQ